MTAKSAARAPATGPAVTLDFDDNRRLARVVGEHDKHLARIEARVGVRLTRRGNRIAIHGEAGSIDTASAVLNALYERSDHGDLTLAEIDGEIRMVMAEGGTRHTRGLVRTPRRIVRARTPVQADYIEALYANELTLGLGPAGTGKTYLAVAVGATLLMQGKVDRMVLSRPAVEAGEKLGFLPGDLKEKVDPYLRPLYDALHDVLPGPEVSRRMESGDIEIAPLAFMRGRTLAHAFVILDEAQNSTPMQMKMFLTRLGEGSRMAITGDPSQTDLPRGTESGLSEAETILADVEGVGLVRFGDADVVRHPLVGRIVRAYAAHDRKKAARAADAPKER